MTLQEAIAEIKKRPSNFVYSVPMDVYATSYRDVVREEAIAQLEDIGSFWDNGRGGVDFIIGNTSWIFFWDYEVLNRVPRPCLAIRIENEKIKGMEL